MKSNDDMKHEEVVKILKSLQQVKAPKYFEADLMRRINSEDFKKENFEEEKLKLTFWQKVFLPMRFIPSMALAVAAVVILFVVNNNSDLSDNPLLTNPRERQDVVSSSEISNEDILSKQKVAVENFDKDLNKKDENFKLQQKENKSSKNNEEFFAGNSPKTEAESSLTYNKNFEQRLNNNNISEASFSISKSGLNFRQVNLSQKEKEVVNQLREKMINAMRRR